jgi:hypothetical protein
LISLGVPRSAITPAASVGELARHVRPADRAAFAGITGERPPLRRTTRWRADSPTIGELARRESTLNRGSLERAWTASECRETLRGLVADVLDVPPSRVTGDARIWELAADGGWE